MTQEQALYIELTKHYFPAGIFDYFEMVNVEIESDSINAYLDESNNLDNKFEGEKLISKGFYPVVSLYDFPIREKKLVLHLRRRKWIVESTGKTVSNDYKVAAPGTHYTQGFATFLKGVFG